MLAVRTVAALLDQITQEIAASNHRAALLSTLREADANTADHDHRRHTLEQRGLMPWDDGWELRSQAHAALQRARHRQHIRAQDARLNLNQSTRTATDHCSLAENASIQRERQLSHQRDALYNSGD
jgi:hypothetical protein